MERRTEVFFTFKKNQDHQRKRGFSFIVSSFLETRVPTLTNRALTNVIHSTLGERVATYVIDLSSENIGR